MGLIKKDGKIVPFVSFLIKCKNEQPIPSSNAASLYVLVILGIMAWVY
jgi:hypothetical protein